MYLNPAYTGNEYYSRGSLEYKNHFPAAGTSFSTYSAMLDTYVDNINSGFGLMITSDRLGNKAFSYTVAGLAYSYNIRLGEEIFLRTGLAANLFYGVRNPSSLKFSDMINIDGSLSFSEEAYERSTALGADFGAGFLFDLNKKFEIGAAVSHLGNPRQDLNNWRRPIKIYARTQYRIPLFSGRSRARMTDIWADLIKTSSVDPFLYYWQQGKTALWGLGADVRISVLKFGLSSRQNFKFSAQTSVVNIGYLSDILEINYAFSIGFLGETFGGMSASSHEICITFKIPTNKEE